MKPIALITTMAVALTAGWATAAPAAPAGDARVGPLREFEGRVVSVNRDAKRFRLRDSERGTVRVKVTRNTRFERIAGFSGLRVGMRNVEVQVRRTNGAWVAREVERSGGGGEHGGDD